MWWQLALTIIFSCSNQPVAGKFLLLKRGALWYINAESCLEGEQGVQDESL